MEVLPFNFSQKKRKKKDKFFSKKLLDFMEVLVFIFSQKWINYSQKSSSLFYGGVSFYSVAENAQQESVRLKKCSWFYRGVSLYLDKLD